VSLPSLPLGGSGIQVSRLNWTPEQMERAWQIADREGVPGPAATQPPLDGTRPAAGTMVVRSLPEVEAILWE